MLHSREFMVKTPRHQLKVNCFYDLVDVDIVKTDKSLFSNMCKSGCKNFNEKYCCPPFSPDFSFIIKDCKSLLVLLLRINLNQLDSYGDYHKLRVGNAIIKPRIEKIMRSLEKDLETKFLSNGACRLCKPCQRKLRNPCRHPDKMRFSLESLGVDCNKLSDDVFKFPLLWYKDKQAPEYTSVVCALPLRNFNEEEVFSVVESKLRELI